MAPMQWQGVIELSNSRRILQVRESDIKKMAQGKVGVISLAQGVTELAPFSFSFFEQVDDECLKYSPQSGLPILRKYLADYTSKNFGMNVSEENILVTSGAITGIYCTLVSLIDEGDEVILLRPYYASYMEQLQLLGAKIKIVDLDEDWQIDANRLRKSMTKDTKLVILCNPSNPAGKILDNISDIIRLCDDKGIYSLIDDTYGDLVYDNDRKKCIIGDNTIITSSFSKNLGIGGLRLGYVCADKDLIKQISKANDAISICAPSISQYFVADLFEKEKIRGLIEEQRMSLKRKRDLICSRLDDLGRYFSYKRPDGAIYVFVKLLFTEDDNRFCKELLDYGVAAVPGSAFGKKGYIRLCFGTSEEKIEIAFDKIKEFICKKDNK